MRLNRISPIIGIAVAVVLTSTAFARPTSVVHNRNVRPVAPIARSVVPHSMIFHHVAPLVRTMMRIAPLPTTQRPSSPRTPTAGPNTRADVRPILPRPITRRAPRPVTHRAPTPTRPAPSPIVGPPA